jgi:hypothetical protein
MKRFSETYGYKPIKNVIQVESMDADLRIGLWNTLAVCYFEPLRKSTTPTLQRDWLSQLIIGLWIDFFKHPYDTIPNGPSDAYQEIRGRFFNFQWYEVYDFVQFVATESSQKQENKVFMKYCNTILEREVSGWRFIGGKLVPITSKEEITEIEEALEATESLRPVTIHLKAALDLMSDRESPDYRNSIKESISAVEAICSLIAGRDKAELPDALKVIAGKISVHGALKEAFIKLYGYTSDAEGIRHALLDEPNLHLEDAKFMLVSCATFINYLKLKASKAGIKL